MRGLVEYRGASYAVPPMEWAVSGLMSPSRPVVRPDSSSILLTSYAAKHTSHVSELIGVSARNCHNFRDMNNDLEESTEKKEQGV